MNEIIRRYLTYYFHDSTFTDAHFDRETTTLTLTLQCDRELDCPENWKDERFTYRLIFAGVRFHRLETEYRGSWMDMQFLIGEFLDSDCKKREEEKAGEPLIHYGIHLSGGWAEILCREIRIERAVGELTEPECVPAAEPTPFNRAETLVLLSRLTNGEALSVRAMPRLQRTLETMAEEKDPQLLPTLRRMLALPGRILLRTTSQLLGKYGTPEDLPLLYAHLPGTKNRPYLRRALLDAIDALAEEETGDTVAFWRDEL